MQIALFKSVALRDEFHIINFEKDCCAENLTHEYYEKYEFGEKDRGR